MGNQKVCKITRTADQKEKYIYDNLRLARDLSNFEIVLIILLF